MRKGWKKAVSTMLCAAMILSMSSFMVSADGEPTIPETPAGDATTEVPGDEKDPEEQPPVNEEKDPADEEKDPADEEKDPADEEKDPADEEKDPADEEKDPADEEKDPSEVPGGPEQPSNSLPLTSLTPAAPAAENGIMPMDENGVIESEEELRKALTGSEEEITISGQITLKSPLTITRGVTIKGTNNAVLTAESPSTENFITITANDVKLENLTISADPTDKNVVHFYITDSGELNNVTVQGGENCSCAVLVNGATVTINGGSITGGKWGNIEYGMGSSATKLPQIKVSGTTIGRIHVDDATLQKAKTVGGGSVAETVKAINESVTGVENFQLVANSKGEVVSTDGTNEDPTTDGAVIVDGVTYTGFEAAVTANAIQKNSQISLSADTTCAGKITLPAGVTLNGNGYTLTLTSEVSNGAFVETTSDDVTIQNITINTDGKAKHGVQFYNCTNGTLTSAIINGGKYTSVIVNGAEVTINSCTLNPDAGAYTDIEYSMGKNVTKIPNLQISNSGNPRIYMDDNTVENIKKNAANNGLTGITDSSTVQDVVDALYEQNFSNAPSWIIGDTQNGTTSTVVPEGTKPTPTPDPGDDNDRPSSGHGSGSSSNSNVSYTRDPEQDKREAEENMWKRAINKINSARDGSSLKIYTGIIDEIPDYVLDALRENNVTVTFYNQDGDEVTIPAGMAPKSLRDSWTYQQLGNYVLSADEVVTEVEETTETTEATQPAAEQTAEQNAPATETAKPNPETGDASSSMMAIAAAAASLCGVVLLSKKNK